MSELNDAVVAEFRAHHGVVSEAMGGHFQDTTVALVHHTGRRTGKERVQPVLCMEHEDLYVLAGSNGGAAEEPRWVANLEAMAGTTLEVGERTLKVRPTVLRQGAERDRLYAAYIDFWPDIADYEKNTDRVFPVVLLEPVE